VARNWGTVREPRIGVMLHYDASVSDASGLAWLRTADIGVSYNYYVLDDGTEHVIAPPDARAHHAGTCRPSDPRLVYRDANSAFWGVSIAATSGERATQAQLRAVADLCAQLFKRQGWEPCRDIWRIVGHNAEAWPRGRKPDPEGWDPYDPPPGPLRPVMSAMEIRGMVASGAPILA
jgi:N-acetyl-anhydromuramyl-L-alanine amidase AmpD